MRVRPEELSEHPGSHPDGGEQVLEATGHWMTRIGLTLDEQKTCLRDARRESFHIFGYTFGPMHSPKYGYRYLGARPSDKAIKRFRER